MTTLAANLTDRYERLEALSGSGLYAVYRARDKSGDGSYLIRIPRAHVLEDSGAVDRFRGVMANISQVAHPNALRVREVGGSDSDLWIISEDSGDPTLKGLLPEGLELGRALDSIADVAEAVDAVHSAGALHGDIRPINVHLSDEGRTQLAGAGVSLLAEAVQSLIRSSMQTPLPSYMAPEILRDA
ncbi:MAG: protein kinase, partial [Dehalococcoidia bacterium]|nr:protein kinase [Dehalococcoidia bacterium]